jgi:hypothetical protein
VNTAGGGGCTARQLLGNPGFETGSAALWTSTSGLINPNRAGDTAHSGTWYAWLDGYGRTHTDTLSQSVPIPSAGQTVTIKFTGTEDVSLQTSFVIDDTALSVS